MKNNAVVSKKLTMFMQISLVPLVLALTGCVTPLPPLGGSTCSPANFTIDKYNAIQVGMSLDQVNQIIGCQPDSNISRQANLALYSWRYISGTKVKSIMVFFDQSSLKVSGSMDDFFKSSAGF